MLEPVLIFEGGAGLLKLTVRLASFLEPAIFDDPILLPAPSLDIELSRRPTVASFLFFDAPGVPIVRLLALLLLAAALKSLA